MSVKERVYQKEKVRENCIRNKRMIIKTFEYVPSDKIIKSSGSAAADAIKPRNFSERAFRHAVRNLISEDPEKDYRQD